MKKRILVLCLALCLLLTGCSTGNKKAADAPAPGWLIVSDVNALCRDAQLLEGGQKLMTTLSDDLLLCAVLDSALPAAAQLNGYDHIVLLSARWLEKYGGSAQLEAVGEDTLTNAQRSYLTQYMADRTVDGSVLPGGAALYTLKKGSLSLLGADGKRIAAKQPLILLLDQPAVVLRADTCLLPLAASGNLFFASLERLSSALSKSTLAGQANTAEVK